MIQQPLQVVRAIFLKGFHVDTLAEGFHWVAVFRLTMAEDHGQNSRGGMPFGVADERRNADTAREQQGRRASFDGEPVAERPPEMNAIPASQSRHFFRTPAGYLEKDDQLIGAYATDGKGTSPGHVQRPALRTDHDELTRCPGLPAGTLQAQGKEPAVGAGEAKGDIIDNCQVV